MSKVSEDTKFTKIEIDEKTKEPKLVLVDAKNLPQENKNSAKNYVNVVPDNPSQLTMKKFLGFQTDKAIDKRKRLFKNVLSVLFIIFAVGVLVFTAIADFSNENIASSENIKTTLLKNWFYLIFAFVSVAVFFVTKGLLRAVLCCSITGRLRLKSTFNAGVICQFYNHITPLAMGGQPFEISYLAKKGFNGGHASSISISAYLINMFVYATMFILAILAYANNWLGYVQNANGEIVFDYFPTYIYVAAIIGTALSLIMPILIMIFSFFPRLGLIIVNAFIWIASKLKLTKNAKLLRFKIMRTLVINAKALRTLFKKPLTLLFASLFGFLEALANASIAYFTLRFFGFDWVASGFIEWLQIITLVILITAAVSFIPTPGSSGAADISFYLLFSKELLVGLAFSAMLTWRILSFYLMIILGFIYVKTVIKKDLARVKHFE